MAEDISGIDVDALLNQANAPHEMPMGDEVGLEPQSQAAPAQEAAPQPEPEPQVATEKFVVDGKEIQATKEQLVKWAQMGYGAPQKIGELNKSLQEYDTKYKPYTEIDQYARENPEWWAQVQEAFAQREAQAQKLDPSNPLAQEISHLKSQLNEFGQFKNQLLEERTLAQYKQEDGALDAEIKSIREKFADLDWKTANEHGHDLERQILKYATDNGIQKFEAAFKAFTYDKALSRAEERGKESVGKAIQKQAKAGIIGKSPTPTTQIKTRQSFKDVSYEDLLTEAKQELGL